MSKDDETRAVMGVITGAHGIKGEVKITSFTSSPADIASYGPLEDKAGKRRIVIVSLRPLKANVLVAQIKDVADRNQAEALKGTELYIDRALLPELDEEEFYYSDLIGLQAEDAEGKVMGRVSAVQNFGAGDLLEIALSDATRTILVPFNKQVVPLVNIELGMLTVLTPEGLLADSDDAETRAEEQRAVQEAREKQRDGEG